MDADILKHRKCWKGITFGMKEWLIGIIKYTNGKPFMYKELPSELKNVKYFRRACSREYIRKIGTSYISSGRGRVGVWVIA